MNELNLYVFPQRDAAGQITYLLSESEVPPPAKSAPPKIDLPRNSQRWQFNFEIKNAADTNVEFKGDPVWAGEDCACSSLQGITTKQVFDVNRLNNSQASFINRNNGKKRTIVYQLNMEEGGVDWPLDPEIRNGGGTGNLWAYCAITGGVVGAAAAFLSLDSMNTMTTLTYVAAGAIVGAVVGALVDRLR